MTTGGSNDAGPPDPHNRFVISELGKVEIAREFFQQHLPADVVAALDWSTLRRAGESFIDERLKLSISDLCFEINPVGEVATADRPISICLLFEHKSTVDALAAFQLLRYITEVIRQQLADGRVRGVVPLLLYHGSRRWTASLDPRVASGLDEPLRRFIPSMAPLLLDLSDYDETQLREGSVLQAILLTLKCVNSGQLANRIDDLMTMLSALCAKPTALASVEAVLRYMSVVNSGVPPQRIRHSFHQNFTGPQMESLLYEPGSPAAFWAEEARQKALIEGRQEGHQEGRQQGLLIGEITILREVLGDPKEQRVELDNLTVDQLHELRQSLRERFDRLG